MVSLLSWDAGGSAQRFRRRAGRQPPERTLGALLPDSVEDGEGEVASLERDDKGRSLVPAGDEDVVEPSVPVPDDWVGAGDGEVVFPDWVEDGDGEVASLERVGPLIPPDDRPERIAPLPMPVACTSSADNVCASSWPVDLRPWACWNSFTAADVFGPMMPSIGPVSKPLSFSACCASRTAVELCA
jgi:hypothetical protein